MSHRDMFTEKILAMMAIDRQQDILRIPEILENITVIQENNTIVKVERDPDHLKEDPLIVINKIIHL